jgi:hypothetical protein
MGALLLPILVIAMLAQGSATLEMSEAPVQPMIVQYEPGEEVAALQELQQRGYLLLRRVPEMNAMYVRLPRRVESQVKQALVEANVASAAPQVRVRPRGSTVDSGDGATDYGGSDAETAVLAPTTASDAVSNAAQAAQVAQQAAAPLAQAAAEELTALPAISAVTADTIKYLLQGQAPIANDAVAASAVFSIEIAPSEAITSEPVAQTVSRSPPGEYLNLGASDPSSSQSFNHPQFPTSTSSSNTSNPFICRSEFEDTLSTSGENIPWGVKILEAEDPTILTVQSSMAGGNLTVCVLDTGIDMQFAAADLTSDISGCRPSNSNLCYFPWDTSGLAADTHGTHVTGTIAAVRGNGRGVVGVAGDHPRVTHVNVFDPFGEGWTYTYHIISALDWCLQVSYGWAHCCK